MQHKFNEVNLITGILPEALQTNCLRCTEKQEVTAYLAIRRLKKEYPKIWQKLQAAWDPNGELVSRFINHVEVTSILHDINPEAEAHKAEVIEDTVLLSSTNQNETAGTATAFSPAAPPSNNNQSETVNTVNVLNRFAEVMVNDNEISSSVATNSHDSPPIGEVDNRPVAPQQLISPASTAPAAPRPTNPPIAYTNIRQPLRPTRLSLLPRPVDLTRLTANVFESIADVGTKVIRTGVRIADMVISGVQASVRPLLVNNKNK